MSGKEQVKVYITYGKDNDEVLDLRKELSEMDKDEVDIQIVETRENDDPLAPVRVKVETGCGTKEFEYRRNGDLRQAIEETMCRF
jgi:uncharacterized protein YpuA (DUF1002 family)